jgi:hypothetical protein
MAMGRFQEVARLKFHSFQRLIHEQSHRVWAMRAVVIAVSVAVLASGLMAWKAASLPEGPAGHEVLLLVALFVLAIWLIPPPLTAFMIRRHDIEEKELMTVTAEVRTMVVSAVTGL